MEKLLINNWMCIKIKFLQTNFYIHFHINLYINFHIYFHINYIYIRICIHFNTLRVKPVINRSDAYLFVN